MFLDKIDELIGGYCAVIVFVGLLEDLFNDELDATIFGKFIKSSSEIRRFGLSDVFSELFGAGMFDLLGRLDRMLDGIEKLSLCDGAIVVCVVDAEHEFCLLFEVPAKDHRRPADKLFEIKTFVSILIKHAEKSANNVLDDGCLRKTDDLHSVVFVDGRVFVSVPICHGRRGRARCGTGG